MFLNITKVKMVTRWIGAQIHTTGLGRQVQQGKAKAKIKYYHEMELT